LLAIGQVYRECCAFVQGTSHFYFPSKQGNKFLAMESPSPAYYDAIASIELLFSGMAGWILTAVLPGQYFRYGEKYWDSL
jgi:hypothetical protein